MLRRRKPSEVFETVVKVLPQLAALFARPGASSEMQSAVRRILGRLFAPAHVRANTGHRA